MKLTFLLLTPSSPPVSKVLFYLDAYFSAIYFLLSIAFVIYKDARYYYSKGTVATEITITVLYGIVQYIRIFMGSKGNKTESLKSLIISMCLGVPACLAIVYLMALQTYVLRMDLILGIISLIFLSAELLVSANTVLGFFHAYRG